MVDSELLPKVHIDQEETKEQVVRGAQLATSFIKKIVAGESFEGKRYNFDEELVMKVHDLLYYQDKNIAGGMLRQTNSTTLGGKPVSRYEDLPWKFRLFGRWLSEDMERLKENPEDIVGALEVAAAAHYGVTMKDTHFFDNGNGRCARALVNAILMSQSYELTAYRLAIPPVPILRFDKEGGRYIRALEKVEESGELNPFMTYLASRWIENIEERLLKIYQIIKVPKTEGDRLLIEKLKNRARLLRDFVKVGSPPDNAYYNSRRNNKRYKEFLIPHYFERRHG